MSDQRDTGERLLRLLAVLAYLAETGSVSVEALAARFQMSPSELVSELELAACCGLPPYTPDQLLELVIDDGQVYAFGLDALRRPPRLTPEEGLALAASARALLKVAGSDSDGPLASALGKLETVLGESRVGVELETPAHLMELRAAVGAHRVVEIDYLGAARGAPTTRSVEPVAVSVREGRFYLDAYCRLAEGWRRFQLARIENVRATEEEFTPRSVPAEFLGSRAFAGGPTVTVAEVEAPDDKATLLAPIALGPGQAAGEGRSVFRIEVADPQWFGRLLLRLGPDATVLSPAELRDAASVTAARALARYR